MITVLSDGCENILWIFSGRDRVTVTTVTPERTAKPFSALFKRGLPNYSLSVALSLIKLKPLSFSIFNVFL